MTVLNHSIKSYIYHSLINANILRRKCTVIQHSIKSLWLHKTLYTLSLANLFHWAAYQYLWEEFSHMVITAWKPLHIARYSFTQLSQLEQWRVKEIAQDLKQQQECSHPECLDGDSYTVYITMCTNHRAFSGRKYCFFQVLLCYNLHKTACN